MAGAHNRIWVLHGANLDALGKRDPQHYGELTLSDLEIRIKHWARELELEATCFQTNHEGEMIEHLHRLPEIADAAVINAGAWTHYSWALRDALEIASVPAVEVHLSDIAKRERWRRESVFEGLVLDAFWGAGPDGYRSALETLKRELGS